VVRERNGREGSVALGLTMLFVVLPALTLIVGVPATLYLVAKRSRGGLVAFAGWIGAVQVGWVPAFDGPFGIPATVFWVLTGLFGGWFVWGFWTLSRAAWSKALLTNRLMRDFGMPASEIV
jgi:hypothetical protein